MSIISGRWVGSGIWILGIQGLFCGAVLLAVASLATLVFIDVGVGYFPLLTFFTESPFFTKVTERHDWIDARWVALAISVGLSGPSLIFWVAVAAKARLRLCVIVGIVAVPAAVIDIYNDGRFVALLRYGKDAMMNTLLWPSGASNGDITMYAVTWVLSLGHELIMAVLLVWVIIGLKAWRRKRSATSTMVNMEATLPLADIPR